MFNEKKLLRELGKQIKAARQAKGLTQEDLAELCEYDATYISLIERGLRNPPFLTICKLANELEVSLKEIFDDN